MLLKTASMLAIAAALTLAGCDRGTAEDAPQPTPAQPAQTVAAPPPAETILAEHQPRIERALEGDGACESCDTPARLTRRANALTAAVAPLDEALAASPGNDARMARTATSAFLHASLELRTCLELSADTHDGVAAAEDCAQPITRFEEALARLRADLIPPT